MEAGENPTPAASASAKHALRQLTFAIAGKQAETTWSFMLFLPKTY
jgi:hypothetical protein